MISIFEVPIRMSALFADTIADFRILVGNVHDCYDD